MNCPFKLSLSEVFGTVVNLCFVSLFLSRPTTLSLISAKQQTSSSSPWWSGPKGSHTSPNSPSMTRSSYYEQVPTHTHILSLSLSLCLSLSLSLTQTHKCFLSSVNRPLYNPLSSWWCSISFRAVIHPQAGSLFKVFYICSTHFCHLV